MQKQSKRNDMEIGLKRLELVRTALLVLRDLLCITKDATKEAAKEETALRVAHCCASVLDTDVSELSSLLEDISCRIATIKEMETL